MDNLRFDPTQTAFKYTALIYVLEDWSPRKYYSRIGRRSSHSHSHFLNVRKWPGPDRHVTQILPAVTAGPPRHRPFNSKSLVIAIDGNRCNPVVKPESLDRQQRVGSSRLGTKYEWRQTGGKTTYTAVPGTSRGQRLVPVIHAVLSRVKYAAGAARLSASALPAQLAASSHVENCWWC